MELKKVARNKNTLYTLIDQRNKMLKKAAIIQEKIDRERKENGRPKERQETKAYTFDEIEELPNAKIKYRVPYDYGYRKD